MRQTLAFWILNVTLQRFHLHACKLGFFYKHPKGKKEYLINIDVNEALRFLKLNCTDFNKFSALSLRRMFDVIEECPYYNKALYATIIKTNLPKAEQQQVGIVGYIDRVRRMYNEIESNYKFSRCIDLYDYVVAYNYGQAMTSSFTFRKTRETFINKKLSTKIVMDKYKLKDLRSANDLIDSFKIFIEVTTVFEQWIMKNDVNFIYKEFDKFVARIKNPYSI